MGIIKCQTIQQPFASTTPPLKEKISLKIKETCTSFSFLPLACSFARLLLRSLAPSLARSLPRSQNHHHHRILLLLDHFICKLVSVERIILVEVLEPPFLFFFFFFRFFWVCWEVFEGLVSGTLGSGLRKGLSV
jgi:hypothetical protein